MSRKEQRRRVDSSVGGARGRAAYKGGVVPKVYTYGTPGAGAGAHQHSPRDSSVQLKYALMSKKSVLVVVYVFAACDAVDRTLSFCTLVQSNLLSFVHALFQTARTTAFATDSTLDKNTLVNTARQHTRMQSFTTCRTHGRTVTGASGARRVGRMWLVYSNHSAIVWA